MQDEDKKQYRVKNVLIVVVILSLYIIGVMYLLELFLQNSKSSLKNQLENILVLFGFLWLLSKTIFIFP
ncbi:hypothetical protein [Gilliamella sp. Pas-s95]|uniref:hypothetical protein n=1 Tax=Gilliamella sp. Pas-s95 TaxID=2687317 RepID=UPI00132BF973|nr:hypothetical protein [Gilliamella sp. Pas-s95]MWN06332.1 hypothetical protein [Gilliamella sp. Pas-s95]